MCNGDMAEGDRAPSFDPLTVCRKIITPPPSKETSMDKFGCFETNRRPCVLVYAFIFLHLGGGIAG